MDTTGLPQRLHDFILKRGDVSMTEIYRLSIGRYTRQEIGFALEKVHKMKDIGRRVKGGDVLYSEKKAPKPRAPPERWKPTPEEQARMDAESRNFWEHSSLITDQERACYFDGFKTQECKELLWTPAERRYQKNMKHGPAAKRIREQEALAPYV